MGVCQSAEERQTRIIDNVLMQDFEKEKKFIKLLLLGRISFS